MNRVIPALILSTSMLLGACQPSSQNDEVEGGDSPVQVEVSRDYGNLPDFFDCVREERGMLIAAHRGGPAPGYPENALETLQNTLDLATPIAEIDVAESRDGMLFLMHDRTLGRTTTGNGPIADTDWAEISRLKLVDDDGKVTKFSPPKLSEVLLWARDNGAIVELDKKQTTSFRNIISHVRAAKAEQNVILITYNDNQALEVARLAPDLMMTASVNSRDHQTDLEEGGVNMKNVIAWTGTRHPNDRAWYALGQRGIESAFGTLGRSGERLDDAYIADGDLSEYQTLADGGLVMLATDEVFAVSRELSVDDKALKACAGR